MVEKLKVEIPVLLPENGDCTDCVRRLQETLRLHKGVKDAHVDQGSDPPRLCLHYDPNLISLAEVERHARQQGITIQQRYRHRNLRVEGMDCPDCAFKLEKGVGRLDGVLHTAVDFTSAKMRVEYDVEQLEQADINERVRRMGYELREEGEAAVREGGPSGLRGLLTFMKGKRRDVLTLIAGVLIVLTFVLEMSGVSETITHAIYGAAIAAGGFDVARKGVIGVWINRELDINFLMATAALGTVAIGAWLEGALVVFLFSLGETLESYTMDRARNAIRSLMELAPAEATLLRDSEQQRVPVDELEIGDLILVRPGERVPMDGVVRQGSSAVNQAPITGESIPVEKRPGAEVFAGSVNGEGALEIEVTHRAEDNTISRVIDMVEEAQAQKAPSQRWVDVFARYYTPAVVGLAVLIAAVPPLLFGQPFLEPGAGAGHGWLYRALSLLIIACPCALVISTPVSIVSAISNAARQGVLFKGGAYLEAAGGLRVVAFDKTGTLTHGEPEVTDVVVVNDETMSNEQLLALAAGVESGSEHPLARAIVGAAKQRGIGFRQATEVEAVTGRGVRGSLDGTQLTIGNRTLYEELGVSVPEPLAAQGEALEEDGKTVMFLASATDNLASIRGLIVVADTVRRDAREAIAALKRSGVRHTVMLTGDNERTASAIAEQAGLDDFRANLLPDEKVEAIEGLLAKHGQVAMVGDGINDAPALARATVGIAMGGAGTDQALETADVALMADALDKLPFAMRLSRRTLNVVRQNIVFSLLVKGAFMALAIPGLTTLWMAVFADMGASLIVILNGMRLLRNKT
ncbi:MAG: heavy metal translocating P-type ATPase [Anaerolineae bacterium]|jgi:Cd2+/Zn2+-exporting ATPase